MFPFSVLFSLAKKTEKEKEPRCRNRHSGARRARGPWHAAGGWEGVQGWEETAISLAQRGHSSLLTHENANRHISSEGVAQGLCGAGQQRCPLVPAGAAACPYAGLVQSKARTRRDSDRLDLADGETESQNSSATLSQATPNITPKSEVYDVLKAHPASESQVWVLC